MQKKLQQMGHELECIDRSKWEEMSHAKLCMLANRVDYLNRKLMDYYGALTDELLVSEFVSDIGKQLDDVRGKLHHRLNHWFGEISN